jgi:hypothetical protein
LRLNAVGLSALGYNHCASAELSWLVEALIVYSRGWDTLIYYKTADSAPRAWASIQQYLAAFWGSPFCLLHPSTNRTTWSLYLHRSKEQSRGFLKVILVFHIILQRYLVSG